MGEQTLSAMTAGVDGRRAPERLVVAAAFGVEAESMAVNPRLAAASSVRGSKNFQKKIFHGHQ